MRQIEWTEQGLADVAALDNSVVTRVKEAIERLARTGAGNVKVLRGIHPPEFRLRVGDWRVRFRQTDETIQVLRVLNRREAYL